jgi:actin-related protein 5
VGLVVTSDWSSLNLRAVTSELLFELYSVPSLTYCVDGLMSFYQNNRPSPSHKNFTANGLVISFNTASTSIIPVLRGKGILSLARRYAALVVYRSPDIHID